MEADRNRTRQSVPGLSGQSPRDDPIVRPSGRKESGDNWSNQACGGANAVAAYTLTASIRNATGVTYDLRLAMLTHSRTYAAVGWVCRHQRNVSPPPACDSKSLSTRSHPKRDGGQRRQQRLDRAAQSPGVSRPSGKQSFRPTSFGRFEWSRRRIEDYVKQYMNRSDSLVADMSFLADNLVAEMDHARGRHGTDSPNALLRQHQRFLCRMCAPVPKPASVPRLCRGMEDSDGAGPEHLEAG